MKSPFKFLDAYTRKDSQFFFGRNKEIERLYKLVFETPLILIYGFSGTGKTSLVQCGLASKFDGSDWFPFFIRRNDNINKSLHDALDTYIDKGGQNEERSLAQKISYINSSYFRPVYLVFDQFEELFIIGKEAERKAEQDEFIEGIKKLLEAKIFCRVIFIIREEYLGQLYHFEKVIPYLFNHRLRVEPMNRGTVKEVLTRSFKKFNINLDPPEESRKEEIIDNISVENARIQLPYLQVYLDGLYKNGYQRSYGENGHESEHPNIEFPPLLFSQEEIENFGTIENVLENFLNTQEVEIYKKLKRDRYRINKNTIPTLLDALVTSEGTKLPVFFEKDSRGNIVPKTKVFLERLPPKISASELSACIIEMESRRIIRYMNNTSFELAHDSLANVIDQKRTEEDKRLNRIYRVLVNTYGNGNYQKHNVFLTAEQLKEYKEAISFLIKKKRIGKNIIEFVEDSRAEAERKKEEELEKVRKEEEIKGERDRKFRAIVFAFFAFILALFAGLQYRKANIQTFETIKSTYKYQVEVANKLKAKGDYSDAVHALKTAVSNVQNSSNQDFVFKKLFLNIKELEPPIDSLAQYEAKWNQIDQLLVDAVDRRKDYEKERNTDGISDSLLISIFKSYLEAYNLDNEKYLCEKINEIGGLIKDNKRKWEKTNETYINSDKSIYQAQTTHLMIYKLSELEKLLEINNLDSVPNLCEVISKNR